MKRVRLRYVANVNPATSEFDRLAEDAAVTFLALESVWPGSFADMSVLRMKSEVASGYTRFREGDILVPKITPTFQANRSMIAQGLLGGVGAGTTEIHVVRPSSAVDARYLLYSLSSRPFLLDGEGSMFGVAGQKRVPDGFLRDWLVVLPERHQQRAIANYLDAETERIDEVIDAADRSVQLLNERRRGVLLRAFAQQDSQEGVRSRVSAMAEVVLGRQRSPEQAAGPFMVRYLRAANVKDGQLDLDDVKEMNFTPQEQNVFRLETGDVLISEGAGSLAAVGANAVWRGELQGIVCIQNTLLRLRARVGVQPRYVAWWARFAYESGLLASVAAGVNIYHLGAENVRRLEARVPSQPRQRAISDALDQEIGQLECQVAQRHRQVELLKERRQALITAAVTGQIEIPGVAA